jgi:tetratricopeptide (TPR) repeat protein
MGTLFGLFLACFSLGQEQGNKSLADLENATHRVVVLRSSGRIGPALTACKDALDLSLRLPKSDRRCQLMVQIHTEMGILLDSHSNFSESETHFLKAVDLQKALTGNKSLHFAGTLLNLGTSRMSRCRMDLAEQPLVSALEILKELHSEAFAMKEVCHAKLCSLYQMDGRPDLAIHHGKAALQLSRVIRGSAPFRDIPLENNLAVMLLRQGNPGEAAELAHSALSAMQKLVGKDHPACLAQMEFLARIRLAQGDGGAAARLYERIEVVLMEDFLRSSPF